MTSAFSFLPDDMAALVQEVTAQEETGFTPSMPSLPPGMAEGDPEMFDLPLPEEFKGLHEELESELEQEEQLEQENEIILSNQQTENSENEIETETQDKKSSGKRQDSKKSVGNIKLKSSRLMLESHASYVSKSMKNDILTRYSDVDAVVGIIDKTAKKLEDLLRLQFLEHEHEVDGYQRKISELEAELRKVKSENAYSETRHTTDSNRLLLQNETLGRMLKTLGQEVETAAQTLLVTVNDLQLFEDATGQLAQLQDVQDSILMDGVDQQELPRGKQAIAMCCIENVNQLTIDLPNEMTQSAPLFLETTRSVAEEYGGVEVRSEGLTQMFAFESAVQAVSWAMQLQEDLLEVPWSEKLLSHPSSCSESAYGVQIFHGLRVPVAIVMGSPLASINPCTLKPTMEGEIIRRLSSIAQMARGGQILLDERTYGEIKSSDVMKKLGSPVVKVMGSQQLTYADGSEALTQITPATLQARHFDDLELEARTIHLTTEVLSTLSNETFQGINSLAQNLGQNLDALNGKLDNMNTFLEDARERTGIIDQEKRVKEDVELVSTPVGKDGKHRKSDVFGQLNDTLANFQQDVLKRATARRMSSNPNVKLSPRSTRTVSSDSSRSAVSREPSFSLDVAHPSRTSRSGSRSSRSSRRSSRSSTISISISPAQDLPGFQTRNKTAFYADGKANRLLGLEKAWHQVEAEKQKLEQEDQQNKEVVAQMTATIQKESKIKLELASKLKDMMKTCQTLKSDIHAKKLHSMKEAIHLLREVMWTLDEMSAGTNRVLTTQMTNVDRLHLGMTQTGIAFSTGSQRGEESMRTRQQRAMNSPQKKPHERPHTSHGSRPLKNRLTAVSSSQSPSSVSPLVIGSRSQTSKVVRAQSANPKSIRFASPRSSSKKIKWATNTFSGANPDDLSIDVISPSGTRSTVKPKSALKRRPKTSSGQRSSKVVVQPRPTTNAFNATGKNLSDQILGHKTGIEINLDNPQYFHKGYSFENEEQTGDISVTPREIVEFASAKTDLTVDVQFDQSPIESIEILPVDSPMETPRTPRMGFRPQSSHGRKTPNTPQSAKKLSDLMQETERAVATTDSWRNQESVIKDATSSDMHRLKLFEELNWDKE